MKGQDDLLYMTYCIYPRVWHALPYVIVILIWQVKTMRPVILEKLCYDAGFYDGWPVVLVKTEKLVQYSLQFYSLSRQQRRTKKNDQTRSWRQSQKQGFTSLPMWWEEDEYGDVFEEFSLSMELAMRIKSSWSHSLLRVAIIVDDDFSLPIASMPLNTTLFSSSTVNAARENVKIKPSKFESP